MRATRQLLQLHRSLARPLARSGGPEPLANGSLACRRGFSISSQPRANATPRGPAKTAAAQRPARSRPDPTAANRPGSSPSSTAGKQRQQQQQQQAQPEQKQTVLELFQQRKWPLLGAGFLAMGIGLYLSLLLASPAAPQCAHGGGESASPTGRPPGVDDDGGRTPEERRVSAVAFDQGLDWPEWLMGIRGLRRWLGTRARGHVLEVAMGTGRNLGHYNWSEAVAGDEEARRQRRLQALRKDGWLPGSGKRRATEASEEDLAPADGEVLSFTGVDISDEMLEVARRRLRKTVPGLKKVMSGKRAPPADGTASTAGTPLVDVLDGRIRLFQADAQSPLPPPPQSAAPVTEGDKQRLQQPGYDTIIQTFGLCSVPDPAAVLANMAAAVRPGTGRIVLLEHGRGWSDRLNGLLDANAGKHFARYGCWWNRDIEAAVRAAAAAVPGLEVVRLDRPLWLQFGTTLVVELRVREDAEAPAATAPRTEK